MRLKIPPRHWKTHEDTVLELMFNNTSTEKLSMMMNVRKSEIVTRAKHIGVYKSSATN